MYYPLTNECLAKREQNAISTGDNQKSNKKDLKRDAFAEIYR